MAFLPKFKKNPLSWTIFLEAFFVAPLFLDIWIEIFGAWVNHRNISNSDIFKEDTAVILQKNGFLVQKLYQGENFYHQPFFIH